MSILIGKDFNKKYKDDKFYKIIHADELNIFKIGENKIKGEFTTKRTINHNYFRFLKLKNLSFYIYIFGEGIYIGEIELLDDSMIIEMKNFCYETDKFILKEKILLKDLNIWKDKEFCIDSINEDPLTLKYVDKNLQDYDLCLLAIKNNIYSFKYVRKDLQDENLCKLVLKRGDFKNFKFIRKDLQNYDLCLLAVMEDRINLNFIRKDFLTKNIFNIVIDKC